MTGDPVGGAVDLDSSDVRYVDSFKLFDKDAYLGVTVNNSPTVQDVWNTTPTLGWSAGDLGSRRRFLAARHPHRGRLGPAGDLGAGAYIFWNDMLYAELTAYGGVQQVRQRGASAASLPARRPTSHSGVQPYWRLAFEPHWGDHYLEVGTFGMYGRTAPSGVFSPTGATDNYTDIGLDSQYQYDGSQYSVTVKLSDISSTRS